MEHDAYSGDYGLGFFGSSLEASSTFVLHPTLGPLCYLCDLASTAATTPATPTIPTVGMAAGADAANDDDDDATVYSILPRDAYRSRVYLEPLGLYVQADAGVLQQLDLSLTQRTLTITFAPPAASAAGARTYSSLRLRADKYSRAGLRPGHNFTVLSPSGVPSVRGAFEIPVQGEGAITVSLGWVQ